LDLKETTRNGGGKKKKGDAILKEAIKTRAREGPWKKSIAGKKGRVSIIGGRNGIKKMRPSVKRGRLGATKSRKTGKKGRARNSQAKVAS